VLTPQFWIQSLWLAFSQIWANKTRSVLTALGIIVGVASVTAVIAALSGLKAKVLTEFESFGANRVFIFPNRPDDAPRNKYPWESVRLKPSEAIELRDQATSLKALTPIVEISGAVESDSKKLDSMQVVGIWPDWHPIEGRRVIMGRAFGQVDEDNARGVDVQQCGEVDPKLRALTPDQRRRTHLRPGRRSASWSAPRAASRRGAARPSDAGTPPCARRRPPRRGRCAAGEHGGQAGGGECAARAHAPSVREGGCAPGGIDGRDRVVASFGGFRTRFRR
jgi:hypothetical protein